MHFGLFSLLQQRDRSKEPRQIYQEMVEQVKLAEETGYEIAWFAEHHFSNYCVMPSPLSIIHYMAPQTSRIKLGPAVIVAPLYEPMRLIEDISVADVLSDGRLVLGFGSGYQQYEFHKFGVKLKYSKKIFNELDWKLKIDFDEGLERTIQWYLDNPEILNNTSPTVLDSTPWKSSN